jgi:hypothetical protein
VVITTLEATMVFIKTATIDLTAILIIITITIIDFELEFECYLTYLYF